MEANVKEIQINGQTYVPKSDISPQIASPIKIVILQRGWVMVGFYTRLGDRCELRKAAVIRQWGTTKGLGEIAQNGPTSSTKLDPTNGLVEFNELTEVAAISVNEVIWSKLLV